VMVITAAWVLGRPFLGELVAHLLPELPGFPPQELATTIHSLGRLRFVPPEGVMAALEGEAAHRLPSFGPQDLANTIHGFAALR
jgi:hypothetical protein